MFFEPADKLDSAKVIFRSRQFQCFRIVPDSTPVAETVGPPSHGGNRGSNPLGSAIFFSRLRAARCNPTEFPDGFRIIFFGAPRLQLKKQAENTSTNSNDGDVTVPIEGAALIAIGGRVNARLTSVREFYEERPLWRIAAVALIPIGALTGYAVAGVWGIVAGMIVAGIADVIAPLGRVKVIERHRH